MSRTTKGSWYFCFSSYRNGPSASRRQPDQRQLLPPGHGLDRRFTFQRKAFAALDLLINHYDWQPTTSVPRCGPGVVLLAAAAHILRNAGVERAIGAPEHVDEPAVARRFLHRPAVLSSHPDKILGGSPPGCPGDYRWPLMRPLQHASNNDWPGARGIEAMRLLSQALLTARVASPKR